MSVLRAASFPHKLLVRFPPQITSSTCTLRRLALKAAEEGRLTAMICSGDAGVYGMAGVLLELAAAYHQVEIEVVPGVMSPGAWESSKILCPQNVPESVPHTPYIPQSPGGSWRAFDA